MRRNSALIVFSILILSGCSTIGNITQKNEYKFETTGLFPRPCEKRVELEKSYQNKKSGFFSRLTGKFKPSEEERVKEVSKSLDCNEIDIERMIATFETIKESDEEKGIAGDSAKEVRIKGFTIYLDKEEKTQRPSTEILYGADALAAVGMPLNPPQLNTPEAIEAYKKYMKAHFAWTFKETNIEGVTDRIYINTKNASVVGPNYTFVITFKDGNVFRRVRKGGPLNTITKEKAFLLGPGGFFGGLLQKGVDSTMGLIR